MAFKQYIGDKFVGLLTDLAAALPIVEDGATFYTTDSLEIYIKEANAWVKVSSSGDALSGYSGYSGQDGIIGSNGVSGYSGYSGQGISGYSGYSGTTNVYIGTPTDGTYTDGLLGLTPSTIIPDAFDSINELLSEIAPANAGTLEARDLVIYNTTTAKITGYLANTAGAAYKIAHPAGTSVAYIIKDALFTLETPDSSVVLPGVSRINYGDQGILKVYVNGSLVDSYDIGTAFNEGLRDGSQTYPGVTPNSPSGYITIVSVAKYNSFKMWQKCIARINIAAVNLVSGYNTIQLVHDLAVDQTSNLFEIWYDTQATTPSVNTPTIVQHALVGTAKWLSGVRYYTINDTFDLSVVGTGLFRNVYNRDSPLAYTGFTGITAGSIAVSDGSVTGLSNPPVSTETMTVTNKVLTISGVDVCASAARITLTPQKPTGNGSTGQSSATPAILVSTFPDATGAGNHRSTDAVEYFRDEWYRMPSSSNFDDKTITFTDVWTRNAALTNGNAQCYITGGNTHALMYPSVNFSSNFLPANTANYSAGFTGKQYYYRCFNFSGIAKSSMNIVLGGVTAGLSTVAAGGDINVEIKMPTVSGWADCIKPYSAPNMTDDGDGCLSGAIAYTTNATFTITFGTQSTLNSNYRIYMRITLNNSNRSITSITCS